MRYFYYLLIIPIVIFSCDSEVNPDSIDIGKSFFPLKTGDLRVYEVEDIVYNIDASVDTLNYYVKEEVVESFYSSEDSTFIIYRYSRPDSASEWQFLETRQSRITSQQAILYEGNTPYLKLTFPISAGKVWDGNLLNADEEDIYQMDSLYFAYNSEMQFDNTLTVIQNDNEDFIVELDRRFEIYAEGVGLIKREDLVYTYCTDDNCLGQQQIETGRKYSETLIHYAL